MFMAAIEHQQAGRLDEGIHALREALTLAPTRSSIRFNLAAMLVERTDYVEAAIEFRKLTQDEPGNAKAWQGLGLCLAQTGDERSAIEALQRALSLDDGLDVARFNLARAFSKLGQTATAIQNYQQLLALHPRHHEAHNNLANLLSQTDAPALALTHFTAAIAGQDKPAYRLNRARLYCEQRQFDAALIDLQYVVKQEPELAIGWSLLAHATLGTGHATSALEHATRACLLAPQDADAHLHRGNALLSLGKLQDAIDAFNASLRCRPGFAKARFNRGICSLGLGDYDSGWTDFESRWEDPGIQPHHHRSAPLWRGEDIRGATLLIHAEQGLGDTLQFCRFVPHLLDRGSHIVLQAQSSLCALLSQLPGITVCSLDEPAPSHDVQCPLLNLPSVLQIRLDNLPQPPYLDAPPQLTQAWSTRLDVHPRRNARIGLVWAGNPAQHNDHNRSMPLSSLQALLALDYTFVSLQQKPSAPDLAILDTDPDILRSGETLQDFADTAALIASLDLVISVCTSVAHLAGAMNKPCWVMLCHAADWRWLQHRSDTPWYPAMRLFRQPRAGDWNSVVQDICNALPKQLSQHAD
ncbi:tetratricopeptide repeat protein [Viridibacterium curvum]|uniref:Tetratricopeptide repeat protein n=1 Tax=Viridibacterium curvum TaxID=1101404 RepID=A0ABP9R037_9RHOO